MHGILSTSTIFTKGLFLLFQVSDIGTGVKLCRDDVSETSGLSWIGIC